MIPSASASSSDPLLASLPLPSANAGGDAVATDFSAVFGQLASPPAAVPASGGPVPVPQLLTFVLAAVEAAAAGAAGGAEQAGNPGAGGGDGEGETCTRGPGVWSTLIAASATGTIGGEVAATATTTALPPGTGRSLAARGPLVHVKAIGRPEPAAAIGVGAAVGGNPAVSRSGGCVTDGLVLEAAPTELRVETEQPGRRSAGAAVDATALAGLISTSPGVTPLGRETVDLSGGADAASAQGGAAVPAQAMPFVGERVPLPSASQAAPVAAGGETALPVPGEQAGLAEAQAGALGGQLTQFARPLPEGARAWSIADAPTSATTGGAGAVPAAAEAFPQLAAPLPGWAGGRPAELPYAAFPMETEGAGELTPEISSVLAAVQGSTGALGSRLENRGEKISSRRVSLAERGEFPNGSGLKTSEESGVNDFARSIPHAGIASAKSEPAMPFPPPELVVPTAFVTAASHRGAGEFSGLESPRHPDLGTQAARAVEAVCTAAELAQRDGRSSLTLRFAMGEADLSVRVEVKEHEVRATFSTESAELRNALAHECAAAAESAGRSFRLTAQISDQGGATGGGAQFSADSGFARREPHHPPQAPEQARLASGARSTHDEPRAVTVAPAAVAYAGQSQHLHTLA